MMGRLGGAMLALAGWLAALPAAATTLVAAIPGDPGHLNPAITTASPVHAVADSVFNGLVALDRDGNPVPDLARSWQAGEGGRRYVFTLDPAARWQDGRPVTADDVVFTFRDVLLRHHARTRASLGPALPTVEAADAGTVVFTFERPYAALLRQLDVTEAPILPRHVYGGADIASHPANLRPVGSGPFRFESYRKDDSVVLARHDGYFKGRPALDRLVFRVIPDAATQVSALIQGEVDYLGRVGPADAARLAGRGVTLLSTRSGPGGANCAMTVAFNLDRPMLADARVRQGFAMGIDRAQMVDRIIHGQGRVAAAPIASGIEWAHLPGALAAVPHDRAAAGRLFDVAGLLPGPDGVRATLGIVHFPQFARYSDLMREQLAPLGIRLAARSVDPAALAQTVFTRRDFDLALISYCNGVDPEIGVRRMYDSAAIGNVPFSNAAGYRNGTVDELFRAAAAATDLGERGRAYRAIQQEVARDLPYWWLVETDFVSAHRNAFTGFAPWSGQFAERVRPAN
ncbi:peptide/nickel transport system substrate-binding protein [Stella humosa]|uniref:Peptide/nickel transport system substrate-binding protein n=1 Tax=Stella humosa TaxID=94 RepID=A0A3N1KUV5_9PROT|nr:ABC transporter substrate-binding protein [Stella humosa]ROP81125.1 peptide/nickel transport system substrate-binding protein [Stella humosa]